MRACVRVKRRVSRATCYGTTCYTRPAIISVALRVLNAAVVRGAAAAGGAADSAGSRMAAAFRALCTVGRTDA